MADGGYTILHRKDERGVIVESQVFGPDDEVPEGFGSEGYQPIYDVRKDDQAPVAESNLTSWSSPIAKGGWIGEEVPAVEEAAEAIADDDESEDDGDELSEGSPLQAREQSGDVEVPPQGGPGSGKDAWAQYAAANGVEVPDDAGRDDIIAACKKAGVPVD